MNGKLADLKTLAKGFLDLATAAAAPPPEPKRPDPPAASPAPAPAPPKSDKIWSADDAGVVLPVALRQEVPRVPVNVATQARDRGLLELIIDEQGRVTSITIRLSVHPVYDPLLMSAARDWRYRPATVNGVPVKFRKVIQITLEKR